MEKSGIFLTLIKENKNIKTIICFKHLILLTTKKTSTPYFKDIFLFNKLILFAEMNFSEDKR